eukprot:s6132_g3.t1
MSILKPEGANILFCGADFIPHTPVSVRCKIVGHKPSRPLVGQYGGAAKEFSQRRLDAVAGIAGPHRQLQPALDVRSQCGQLREGCPAPRKRGPRGHPRQRLAVEAPANLEPEDHQAATSLAGVKGIDAELARLGLLKFQHWLHIGTGSRATVTQRTKRSRRTSLQTAAQWLASYANCTACAFCAAALRRRRHLGVYFSVVYAPLLSLLSLPLTGPAKFSLSDILADSPLEPLV